MSEGRKLCSGVRWRGPTRLERLQPKSTQALKLEAFPPESMQNLTLTTDKRSEPKPAIRRC